MPSFRTAEVLEVLAERPGLQRISVRLADGTTARAYALTELTGSCAVGDRVVLNTTAVELGLGTGGWHVVHWNLERDELVRPGPEHIMKLRYTSLQFDAGTDELAHPECDEPLGGVPVVVCTVHSQVAAVAAAIADAAPGTRVVYVMTDGASLPLALSDLVATLTERDLLAATVTAGHAFGGDLEAVSPASALGLAVHTLGAEIVVVGMGPGVVGTGTATGDDRGRGGAAARHRGRTRGDPGAVRPSLERRPARATPWGVAPQRHGRHAVRPPGPGWHLCPRRRQRCPGSGSRRRPRRPIPSSCSDAWTWQ